MKRSYIVYLLVAFVILVVPSVGLAFGGGEVSSDGDAAQPPSLTTADGAPNPNVLKEAGDWFDDHFAFRNEWVTAASAVTDTLFGTSANKGVVTGTDGWLYYENSLGDYTGGNHLSDRQLRNIAYNLSLMQDYALSRGSDFVFTVAPNKNTLYPEHMPYYYTRAPFEDHNLARLVPYLAEYDVNYVDLHARLAAQDGTLYHARDSHWNNVGASQAADEILGYLEREHRDYASEQPATRVDYEGDLDKMARPAAVSKEAELYYDPAPDYGYEGEVESNFDSRIETNGAGEDGLLMYRDSFGNALLPFMAENYDHAFFSRGVPYQLATDMDLYEPDTVVVERAERFLSELAAEAPAIPATLADGALLDEDGFVAADDVETEEAGERYTAVSGTVPAQAAESVHARLYVRLNGGAVYEACGVSGADGAERFSLLVPTQMLGEGTGSYEILVANE